MKLPHIWINVDSRIRSPNPPFRRDLNEVVPISGPWIIETSEQDVTVDVIGVVSADDPYTQRERLEADILYAIQTFEGFGEGADLDEQTDWVRHTETEYGASEWLRQRGITGPGVVTVRFMAEFSDRNVIEVIE
jgi:hypothetical protein